MSLENIDVLLLGLLALFSLIGWWQGFVRSLIGPFGFMIGLWSGILNFDLSGNFILSVWMGVVVASGVTGGLYMLILLSRRTLAEEERKYVHWGSRTAGAAANTAWCGMLTGVVLVLLTVVPTLSPQTARLKTDLGHSQIYNWFYSRVFTQIPSLHNPTQIITTFSNPGELQQAAAAPEFIDFFNHPKMQELMKDPGFHKALSTNDVQGVTGNPRVQAVLHDRRLMQLLTKSSKAYYKRRFIDGDTRRAPVK